MGQSYDYGELQGLTKMQVEQGGAANFRIVREAGTIDCTGKFSERKKARETFKFTAIQHYVFSDEITAF